jgi:disulfide bond formation protein DsbB
MMLQPLLIKHKDQFSLLLLGAAILSLGSAYLAEYGFGLKPCILCLYERVPYAIVLVAAFLMLTPKRSPVAVNAWLKLLCALAFSVGAGIAFFHVGVEHHWWEGTEKCSGSTLAKTLDELKSQILGAPTVRCDEPAFVFLGISMAGYNMLWSIFLAGITFYSLKLTDTEVFCGGSKKKK